MLAERVGLCVIAYGSHNELQIRLTWRDPASVRIKLKVPATQRHHRERAARADWLAISKVRFLYGLPTYFTT